MKAESTSKRCKEDFLCFLERMVLSSDVRLTWVKLFLVTPRWVWPKPRLMAPHRGHRRIGETVSGVGRAGDRGRGESCRAMAG